MLFNEELFKDTSHINELVCVEEKQGVAADLHHCFFYFYVIYGSTTVISKLDNYTAIIVYHRISDILLLLNSLSCILLF